MAANSGGRKTASSCLKCKLTVKKDNPALQCDGFCENWFHTACVDVSDQNKKKKKKIIDEVLCMCPTCKWHLKNFMVETQRIKKHNHTYANILSNKSDSILSKSRLKNTQENNICNKKTLLIKPKKNQKTEDVEKEVKHKINPAAIKFYKATKHGVIIMKSDSATNIEKLRQHAEDSLNSSNYNIELRVQSNPRLKIVGVNKNYVKAEDLVEDLKILNRQYFCDKDRMEIKHTRQSQRNKKWTIFVETDGHTFTKLVNTKLDLGWGYCSIYEDLYVRMCNNCCGYNHKTSECRNEKKFSYCAKNHTRSTCTKEFKQCVNCTHVRDKYDATRQVNHESDSVDCPIYSNKIKLAQDKINYFSKLD